MRFHPGLCAYSAGKQVRLSGLNRPADSFLHGKEGPLYGKGAVRGEPFPLLPMTASVGGKMSPTDLTIENGRLFRENAFPG